MRFDLLRTSSEQNRKLPVGALQPGSMRETYFKEGTQMISTLKKKLNKKGFTLAELLIVIAIIAILVAVAVPVFSSQLTKAKTAVIDANARAIKAQVTAEMLTDDSWTNLTEAKYYVDKTGNVTKGTTAPTVDYYEYKVTTNKDSGTVTVVSPAKITTVSGS